ncbi:SoxR reducing system RseC family protein [Candidatus Venteria ishoeyi]|uniref:SoxR reducing system RseC family protein n=1 Tax=Candidatus Venteria ishoeyi TaxID=1899563 RepID=UPI0025A4D749|nr:SoxR reducing system RseC family protein [Candidatus Venteria ishoeyi]MDM8544937.1 SoxR reducing system RseC family protein [Candidatus Venteria ishoeyi]
MLTAEGTVVASREEDGENWIWVETRNAGGCNACGAGDGCGTGAMTRYFSARQSNLKLPNSQAAEVGDQVLIGLPEQAILQASSYLYLYPLLFLFLGLLAYEGLAYWLEWSVQDGWALLAGFCGLAVGLQYMRRKTNKRNIHSYQPRLLSILQK